MSRISNQERRHASAGLLHEELQPRTNAKQISQILLTCFVGAQNPVPQIEHFAEVSSRQFVMRVVENARVDEEER